MENSDSKTWSRSIQNCSKGEALNFPTLRTATATLVNDADYFFLLPRHLFFQFFRVMMAINLLHPRLVHGQLFSTSIETCLWKRKLNDVNCFGDRGTWAFFSVLPWPAFSIAMWTSGSTLLSLGLTVGQAMAAAVSYVLPSFLSLFLSPQSQVYVHVQQYWLTCFRPSTLSR